MSWHTIRRILLRWTRQQDTAILQMTQPKTGGRRISGWAKSERIEAKFFLLAVAPAAPLIIFDELGLPRGLVWWTWLWLCAGWGLFVFGVMFVGLWAAFRRSVGLKRNDR